ncbi:uncharacterized protein MONBRDRAFT_26851 [Monosiga brevicollis MX1]|uniref:Condensin-2 complex subunit H2 n=1 Tax=Monosiga brevicollis TaxID=81824 RepID=A9V3Q2_MONBE|nr:uncharacterized protein MONBRDRAFT_26851 [Monosiga brevicollis MX1]EDQ87744.1 predicted protein [Monosiga brevicollis MX1]|eukprot:XP_001747277.1 hypothetical protein [Monosiga brevicollis MX1]
MTLSGDGAPVESRFQHLLQPIRDIADNWNIDIARELEEYLGEIENLEFCFEGSSETFNFAEAALVIQGSACIYSKKVEYLYNLVYETLNKLADKRRVQDKSSVDADGNDADAAELLHEDHVEFLSLDDLPQATNIDLQDHEEQLEETQDLQRMPLCLMPVTSTPYGEAPLLGMKGDVIGNRKDFKMNTSILHDSGALLLGDDASRYVDHSFIRPTTSFAVPSPGGASPSGLASPGGPQIGLSTPRLAARREDDPWATMDPHENNNTTPNQPYKRLTSLKVGDWFKYWAMGKVPRGYTIRGEHIAKDKKSKASTVRPLTAFLQQQRARRERRRGTVAFMPALSQLCPDRLRAEEQRRADAARQDRINARRTQHTIEEQWAVHGVRYMPDTPELSRCALAEMPDADGPDMDDFDHDDGYDAPVPDAPQLEFEHVEHVGPINISSQSDQPASTSLVQPAYEDLVQDYIQKFIAESEKYRIETDLTRRVETWKSRIQPVLEEEDQRPAFDIHDYGAKLMTRLPENKKKETSFPEIAPKESFQVARDFLALLQLANNGNVEIVPPKEGKEFGVKLLHRQQVNQWRFAEQALFSVF